MDGFNNNDYYLKAYDMGLIPITENMWRIQNDIGAYHDLHKVSPVIGSNSPTGAYVIKKMVPPLGGGTPVAVHMSSGIQCLAINTSNRTYEYHTCESDKIQRMCRSLILKNNLINL